MENNEKKLILAINSGLISVLLFRDGVKGVMRNTSHFAIAFHVNN